MTWSNRIPALVDALAKHEKDFPVDKELFYRSLLIYDMNADPSTIYHPISHRIEQQLGNKRLVIDGILYSSRMSQVRAGLVPFIIKDRGVIPKKIDDDLYDIATTYFNKLFNKKKHEGEPSKWNESVLENMIKDPTIMSVLIEAPVMPYSLLARMEVEEEKGDQWMVYTKPILVKPGISDFDRQSIYRWEEKNSKKSRLPSNI